MHRGCISALRALQVGVARSLLEALEGLTWVGGVAFEKDAASRCEVEERKNQ
jgi:hypothetical protein